MRGNVAGALNYADWHLSLLLGLHDAAGGLLASALAGPNGGPLAVNLTGDGPLTASKAQLSATLANSRSLTPPWAWPCPWPRPRSPGP
jgi:translocation and assembly module TamB